MGIVESRYDLGVWWRGQAPRSLDEIDQLYQRRENLRDRIGRERSEQIDKAPELITDGESIRKAHAKGRNRGFVCTVAAYCLGIGGAKMFLGVNVKAHPLYRMALVPSLVATYIVFYNINATIGGRSKQAQQEFLYAGYVRQLRNIQIK